MRSVVKCLRPVSTGGVKAITAKSPPAFALTFALLLAFAAAIDVIVGAAEIAPWSVVWSFGVGFTTGFLLGGILGIVMRVLKRVSAWLLVPIWLCAGGGVAWWLIYSLGVMGLMSGKEKKAAMIALAASVAIGTAVVIGGLLLSPRRRFPKGVISAFRLRYRLPLLLGLTLAVVGTVYVDRFIFVGLYPPAHAALRWAGLLTMLLVVVGATTRWPTRRLRARSAGWLFALTIVALPFVVMRQTHYAELGAMLSKPYSSLPLELLRKLGDPDFDSYSMILGGGDCAPFDATVHPGATEIPANGLDDNCRGGDAEARAGVVDPTTVPIPTKPAPMSIVLITIDTLRADHMSAYGWKNDTTPGLKKWADKYAVRFDRAYTSGGWTSLAITSMLRGVYPRRLQWNRLYETQKWRLLRAPVEPQLKKGEKVRRTYAMPIDDPRAPLPWWLRRRGMHTAAVIDDGFSEFLSEEMGIAAGFDTFKEIDDLAKTQRNDSGTSDLAIKQLRSFPKDKPFFLWVHYFGPHNPSRAHKNTPTFGKSVADKYDHEIAFMDRQLMRFVDVVEEESKGRPVATIIAADHGEILKSNWRNHGVDVSEATIHIPMFLRAPGLAAGSTTRVVSLVDIMPTVLAMTDTPGPPVMDGRDLRAVLTSSAGSQRVVLSELWGFNSKGDISRNYIGALDGTHKLILNIKNESKTLYRQADRYSAQKPNLLDKVKVPHLERALDIYLDQSGRLELVD
jgi:hypothetical protein